MQRQATIIAAAVLALLPATADAGSPQYATPTFLLPYNNANLIDYRPAINAAGTRIVFERQLPVQGKKVYSDVVDLYISDLQNPNPTRLVPGSNTRGTTRPDWCWSSNIPSVDGPITFAAVAPASDDTKSTFFAQPGIYYTMAQPQAGGTYTYVPKTTAQMTYPTWFPGCTNLAVYVSNDIQYLTQTGPETIKFDLAGNQLRSLSGTKLWAGFPSVNQRAPHLLALAAQQFNANGYNQNLNYVYIADESGTPPRVVPLDPNAPRNRYAPRFEGRAPTWSPDGQWIAFESDRNCALPKSAPYYAIFIQDALGQKPAQQVTDCSYNAQHAKWYRQPVNNRNLLITAVRLHPSYTGDNQLLLDGRGIAALDVTPFLHH